MITTLMIIAQITGLLVMVLLATTLFRRNPSKAHAILSTGLISLLALPLLSFVAIEMGWGFWSPGKTEVVSVSNLPDELIAVRDPTPVRSFETPEADTDSHFQGIGISQEDDFDLQSPAPVIDTAEELLDSEETTETESTESDHEMVSPANDVDSRPAKSNQHGIGWFAIFSGVWIALSAFMSLRLFVGSINAWLIVRDVEPVNDKGILKAFKEAKSDLKVSRNIQLVHSVRQTCPVIWSWYRPVVVIPTSSLNRSVDWRTVLSHELAHGKRLDHVWALLAEITCCVFPWHPLVVLGCRHLNRLSDLACDEWAVRFSRRHTEYAESLLSFAPVKSAPLFSTMATNKSDLHRRVELLLDRSHGNSRAGFAFTCVVLVIATVTCAVLALYRTYREQPVTFDNSTSSEVFSVGEVEDERSDEEWVEVLTSVPSDARWFVGNNLGNRLAVLPGDRGYKILEMCWVDIEPGVRQQILKGFTPGFGGFETINDRFFDVIDLGMKSDHSGVRQFAKSYLQETTLGRFARGFDDYDSWRTTTTDKTASQIIESEIRRFIKENQDLESRNIPSALSILRKAYIVRIPEVKAKLKSSGLEQLLDQWVDSGWISRDHRVFEVLKPTPKFVPINADEGAQLSDEEWIERLTTVPDNSRWYVGANFGKALSQLPGDRGYKILKQCWSKIPTSVRTQILKGFSPGFGAENNLNEKYFAVLNLGMESQNDDIEEFATTYLNQITLKNFVGPGSDYLRWQKETRDLSNQEIIERGCQRFVAELQGQSKQGVAAYLKQLDDSAYQYCHEQKQALVNAGIVEVLEQLISSQKLDLGDSDSLKVVANFPVPDQLKYNAIDLKMKSLEESWRKIFSGNPDDSSGQLSELIDSIGSPTHPRTIPTLIGMIDADNSSTTIYHIGYFILQDSTGVRYSRLHDGAWWRRWWEKNKSQFSDRIAAIPIPDLPKTKHGRSYTALPETLETFEGKIEWIVEQFKAGNEFDRAIRPLVEEHNDPRAIPTLIGMIDADNSYNTVYNVGYFGLHPLTDVDYNPLHDGAWWRRWWEKNKSQFSEEAQTTPIPDLPKTAHGENYQPFSEHLETTDGKVAALMKSGVDDEFYELILSSFRHAELTASDIPKLIGILDADNSRRAISWIPLDHELTGVNSSPLHDGAWWRRWWERNKHKYPAEVQRIPIPDLPKTDHGRDYVPFPEGLDSLDGKIEYLKTLVPHDAEKYEVVVDSITTLVLPGTKISDTCIPKMIGIIEADNSYATVYGVGYFGLSRVTNVNYNPTHDGAWWRRWWERNKKNFSQEAQNTPIPELPKTPYGKKYQTLPAKLDSLDGKIEWMKEGLPSSKQINLDDIAEAFAEHRDSRAIPYLIGWLNHVDTERQRRDLQNGGLCELTGVKIEKGLEGKWWVEWWENNRTKFPDALQEVPDLNAAVKIWKTNSESRKKQEAEDEFDGVPSVERTADDNEKMRYFQIGPPDNSDVPDGGWKIVLILPGGAGDDAFNPFCRRIHKHALPKDYVAVELVAPKWSDDENRTVWPTNYLSTDDGDFTTEEFIAKVVEDVKNHIEVNDDYIFALGWSSGGPAVYANSMDDESVVTGSYIAMSVFNENWLPDLENAKGHNYFILHSPDDFIDIEQARTATRKLRDAGAETRLKTYNGGHGWRGDPYGNIRTGIKWLEEKAAK